ncbi:MULTISPECIES: carbohydrate ABC transporter permease [Paenibacillus]|uniref:Sugar ABC transporter permease n=1 Tax=Paenibacillus baimaensis TaxID=2982185 RepID=A0ABT2UQ18_9BACL|nr:MULTISPECIES: sugar ABC transporter permease [unclassified Paenibacillus]MCU6796742.1 sugar ABC transporter permease [Paenibacillus sp. WQ 127069]OMF14910.1 ABC transporter permease [Paenibacillus sp. FSL H7-0331]
MAKFNRFIEPIWGYVFISPWLLGLFVLTIGPMSQSFYLSLTAYNLLELPTWIGFGNYHEIFTDDKDFWKAMQVTFTYVVLSVPLKLFFALMVAMLLFRAIRGMSVFRAIFYLPSLIGGSVAISAIWRNLFGADGFLNKSLSIVGIQGIDWINTPGTALYTLVLLAVWQFGSSMVIFLAGLKQIPRDLYESASVDGASKIRSFFAITLPMLTPIILFNLVMQIIGSFQMFTQAFIVTKGGPINSTLVYALYVYQKAFAYFNMGYASALAWILLMIIAVFTALIFWSAKRWVHYET